MWSTDRLIDDVARSMTSDAASIELRAAVLARIRRRPVWRATWVVAIPVAAAVVLIFAVGFRQPQSRSTPTADILTKAQVTPPVTIEPPTVATSQPIPRTPARRPMTPALNIRTIAVLAEPLALKATDIQPNALVIPLLSVKPIGTEPLAMPAIDDGSGGRQPRF